MNIEQSRRSYLKASMLPKTAGTTLPPPHGPHPPPIPATNTPIAVLNDDVLLRIFSLNADMGNETIDISPVEEELFRFKALFVTWRTSQVSRHWRHLMLVSPTIWGNVIDLSLLRGDKSEWRDEVLRRSRSSLLSVKGFIDLYKDPSWYLMSGEMLHTLLHDIWARLRSVDIVVGYSDRMSDESWVTLFRRPSRYLESFSVCFLTSHTPTFASFNHNPIDFTIFSDFAPSLRKFSNNQIPIESFVQSSWLSHIRALTLLVPTPTLFSQILSILMGLRCLEVLSIHTLSITSPPSIHSGYTDPVPIIHLPYLQFISFRWIDFEVWSAILDCISPKPGCSLSICSGRYAENPDDKNILVVSSTLSRYLNAFISSHFPIDQKTKKLGIRVLVNGFSFFFENTQRYQAGNLDSDYFRITFAPRDLLNFGSVFSALPNPILEATTELHLVLEGCCFTRNPGDPQFIRFLSSFTSVETLTTEDSSSTLAALLDLPGDAPMIFPSLRTLKLVSPVWVALYTADGPERSIEHLFSFLSRRRALGVPIQTLEVMDSWRTYESDLKLLDEISGLKVVWKGGGKMPKEYVCGGGAQI